MSNSSQRLLLFVILMAALMAGFFIPMNSGWFLPVLKGLVFCFLLAVMYRQFFAPGRSAPGGSEEPRAPGKPVPADAGETAVEEDWGGFRETYRDLTVLLLGVARKAVVGCCSGLYLRKGDGLLEFRIGDAGDGCVEKRMIVPRGDALYRVLQDVRAFREGKRPAGATLAGLPPEIRSFVASPVLIGGEVRGVLAVGSEVVDQFGEEDVDFLCRCGELQAEALDMCQHGIQAELNQAVRNIHLRMEKTLLDAGEADEAVSVFVRHIKELFVFHRFTVCRREGGEGVVRYVYGQIDHVDCGARFRLEEGLNGWVMKRGQALIIEDMEQGDYVRPRYFRGEETRHGLRSYLGIPLKRGEDVWGAVSLESREIRRYGERERSALMMMASPLQISLELFEMRDRMTGMPPGESSPGIT